jgi:hypothetical protein
LFLTVNVFVPLNLLCCSSYASKLFHLQIVLFPSTCGDVPHMSRSCSSNIFLFESNV